MGPTQPPVDQSNNGEPVPAQDVETPHNAQVINQPATAPENASETPGDTHVSSAKRFLVDLFQTVEHHTETFIVEAEDEVEAKAKAEEILATKELEGVLHRIEIKAQGVTSGVTDDGSVPQEGDADAPSQPATT